jgi:hypothetical protein
VYIVFFNWWEELVLNIKIKSELLSLGQIKSGLCDIIHLIERQDSTAAFINYNEASDLIIELINRVKTEVDSNTNIMAFKIDYRKKDRKFTIEAFDTINLIYGFYFLLQEKLGFLYIHPEEVYIPSDNRWRILDDFTIDGTSKFEVRGYHLHTLHPIEMANFLFIESEDYFLYVKNYIDHLVRCGQNCLQFYLLKSVDLKSWQTYAKKIVDYAHLRGIKIGVMVSIFRIQQYSFKLLKLRRFNILSGAKKNIDMLSDVGFDHIAVEAPLGEFLPDLINIFPGFIKKIEEYALKKGLIFYYAKHIVKKDHKHMDPLSRLKHNNGDKVFFQFRTVMCYSMLEYCMGAYENDNFSFVYEDLKKYNKNRKNLFWPTATYWVAFDNSVPLFILHYLKARFDDINCCEQSKTYGHLTFSSGMEWGYWLIESSISQYTWRIRENGVDINADKFFLLKKLLANNKMTKLWEDIFDVEEDFLFKQRLLPELTGVDPFVEFPFFNHTFQPRQKYAFKYVMYKANNADIEEVNNIISKLSLFSSYVNDHLESLEKEMGKVICEANVYRLLTELLLCTRVLALRARHRAFLYKALILMNKKLKNCRAKRIIWIVKKRRKMSISTLKCLVEARKIRIKAEKIVKKVEKYYRYDKKLLTGEFKNFTAYDFGYLFTVSNLFFWKREEEQVLKSRFDPFFNKLWNILKIIGIK